MEKKFLRGKKGKAFPGLKSLPVPMESKHPQVIDDAFSALRDGVEVESVVGEQNDLFFPPSPRTRPH